MKEILLSNGLSTTVDDQDYDWLSRCRWYAITRTGDIKAARTTIKAGHQSTIYMHREILNAPKGTQVDHIDGNGLNNIRSNLRFCNDIENQRNRHRVTGISPYKGVNVNKCGKPWRAQIKVGGKRIHLGVYDTQEEAAQAYNDAAIKYFGDFACLNEI